MISGFRRKMGPLPALLLDEIQWPNQHNFAFRVSLDNFQSAEWQHLVDFLIR